MKIILTILSLLSLNAICQDTLFWITGDENTISTYNVQKVRDTSGSWVSIATLEKGKSFYWYKLPKETSYYRVKASGLETFVTKAHPLTIAGNAVTITNALRTSTTLSWNASGESNMNYYLIEKSNNNWKTFTTTTKVQATGAPKYSYKYSRTIFTYKYRVTAIFKDGKKSIPTIFK